MNVNSKKNKTNTKKLRKLVRKRINQDIRKEVRREIKSDINTLTSGVDRIGIVTSTNPAQLRKYKPKQALSALQYQSKIDLHDYMLSMLHPDYAVRNGLNARIPSLIGSPSVTYRSHQVAQFSTGSTGAFLFRFMPGNMLQQSDGAVKFTVFNNTCNGTGIAGTNTLISGLTYNYPDLGQRYRLVSCLVRVSYNGTVLNQSGKLMGCYTFESSIVSAGPSASAADTNLDRYSTNFSLIRNGLWNNEVNITKDADGIEMLYAPLDPDAHIYRAVGEGFHTGQAYPTSTATQNVANISNSIPQLVIAGNNFPVSANCISVEVFQVFEVIPDPTGAFMFNSGSHIMNSSTYESVAAVLDQAPKVRPNTSGIVREALGAVKKSGSKLIDSFLEGSLDKTLQLGKSLISALL